MGYLEYDELMFSTSSILIPSPKSLVWKNVNGWELLSIS